MGKRKQKQKNEDFKKTKLKVGQQQVAANATKTDFKSKTISVPAQSISDDKGDVTNQRNLTLKELLGQVRHYNATVRKDALHGMKDLFVRHPHVLSSNLVSVIERIMPCAVDVEPEPRQGLLTLLAHITSALPQQQLAPFYPLIMVFVRSAMTHIREDISHYSLEYVDMLLSHTPQLLVANGKDILLNFVRLLGKRPTGKAGSGSTNTAPSAKAYAHVLVRLHAFITELLAFDGNQRVEGKKTTQVLEVSPGTIPSLTLYPWGEKLCDQQTASIFSSIYETTATTAGGGGITTGEVAGLTDSGLHALSDNRLANPTETLQFIQAVMPRLVEAWVESSPSALGPGTPNSVAVGVLKGVLDTVRQLWRHLYAQRLQAESDSRNAAVPLAAFAKDVKRHWMGMFPFGENRETEAKLHQTMLLMNYSMCDIVGLLFLAGDASEPSKKGKPEISSEISASGGIPTWGQKVLDYVIGQLETVPDEAVSHGAGTPIATLLAVVETLLLCLQSDSSRTESLLEGVLSLYDRLKPISAAKPKVIGFLADHGLFGSTQGVGLRLLSSLPKLLWQLGSKVPKATEDILHIMAKTAIISTPGSTTAQAFQALQAALVPCLYTTVPNKQGGARAIYGPFVSLPPHIQHMFINVLSHMSDPSPALLKGLGTACLHQSVGAEVSSYAADVAVGCWGRAWADMYEDSSPPRPETLPSLVGLLLTLAVGYTKDQMGSMESSQSSAVFPAHTTEFVEVLRQTIPAENNVAAVSLRCTEVPLPSVEFTLPETVYEGYWAKRQLLVGCVVGGLQRLPLGDWEGALDALTPAIMDIVTTTPGLPYDAAVSLLWLVTGLCERGAKANATLVECTLQLALSVLVHAVTYPVRQPGCSQAVKLGTVACIRLAAAVQTLPGRMVAVLASIVADCGRVSILDLALLATAELVRAPSLQPSLGLCADQIRAIISTAQGKMIGGQPCGDRETLRVLRSEAVVCLQDMTLAQS